MHMAVFEMVHVGPVLRSIRTVTSVQIPSQNLTLPWVTFRIAFTFFWRLRYENKRQIKNTTFIPMDIQTVLRKQRATTDVLPKNKRSFSTHLETFFKLSTELAEQTSDIIFPIPPASALTSVFRSRTEKRFLLAIYDTNVSKPKSRGQI